jgi:hypothetical protein
MICPERALVFSGNGSYGIIGICIRNNVCSGVARFFGA